MKELPIVWKRLVAKGQTCQRCGTTQGELEGAVGELSRALAPLGIQPALHEEAIDEATFKAQPSESNRIWINGQAIETLLGARVGASPCCSVCGDSPCRTLELGGSAYESVPASLIVQAGLRAAADLMSAAPTRPACPGCSCGGTCP